MRAPSVVTLAAILLSVACTRYVDAPAPVRAWPVAPVTAGQVSDLLSPKAEPEAESNLFLYVDPPECAGVAREVDPPFLFDIGTTPAAHTGGQWNADGGFSVQEMAAVYPANFNSQSVAQSVRNTVSDCENESLAVVTTEGDTLHFSYAPAAESPAPEIVLWSLTGPTRSCDNAYVAAYNVAIEITACGDRNGYDVAALAEQALNRFHALANMKS